MSSLSAYHSARSKSEIRGVKTPLICLSFLRELRGVIIALICLINDRGYDHFLGVRSEFNTHNPAICQAYLLPLPNQNLSISCFIYVVFVRFVNCTLLHIVLQSQTIQPKSISFSGVVNKLLIMLVISFLFHVFWSFRETIKHISTTSRTPSWFYLSSFFQCKLPVVLAIRFTAVQGALVDI